MIKLNCVTITTIYPSKVVLKSLKRMMSIRYSKNLIEQKERLRSLSFVLSTLGHYEVTTTVMTGIFLRMLKDGMQNVVVEAIG